MLASHHVTVSDAGGGVWMFWLAILLVLAVAAALIYLEHKRRERIKAFAAARHLRYVDRDDQWAQRDLGWPAGEGHSHKARNVLTGFHNGRHIAIFEHEWVTGSGKERQTHHARVTAMSLPRSFPKLEVRLEGMFGRAARRLGFKDIELESDQFNERYRVGGDRRLAYDVLNPRFMQWLLRTESNGFVISGQHVAYTVSGKIDLERLDHEVGYLDEIIRQLPNYVING